MIQGAPLVKAMLYQKHKKLSHATQKNARGKNFHENQRQESSRRSPCFWMVTSFGRGCSWLIPCPEIEGAEFGAVIAPSVPAGVSPVVGFGSRKVCRLPQYSQVKISVSAENTVYPPQEGHSSVMISFINYALTRIYL